MTNEAKLQSPAKTAPKLDGVFGASEYAVSYTLNAAAAYVDAASVSAGVLDAPANAEALTSSIKVGMNYDVEFIYVAIEATLDADVATATYSFLGQTFVVDPDAKFDDRIVAQNGNKIVVEYKMANDTVDVAYGVVNNVVPFEAIVETTINADEENVNYAVWNAVKLTNEQRFEYGAGAPVYVYNTYVLGADTTTGTLVTVEQEPVGVPGQTKPSETEAPATTEPEAATTEAPATEPEATEPEATEPEATEPEATEPEVTTEEVPAKTGCGASVSVMGLALVAALGTCAVVASKKED